MLSCVAEIYHIEWSHRVTILWERKSILFLDLSTGTTVKTECYCKTLQDLLGAINNKRCGVLSSDVVQIHNNVRSHMAITTKICCRNIAARDFYLFLHLKKFLSGCHFPTQQGVQTTVTCILDSQWQTMPLDYKKYPTV